MKKIGIIGAGWLGVRLAKHFKGNFEIHTTTTSAGKLNDLKHEGFHPTQIEFSGESVQESLLAWSILHEMDVLIITVNFSKRTELQVLHNRFENISLFIQRFDKQMFLMSSTGVYPQTVGEITETSFPDEQLQPNIQSVEQQMQNRFPQINVLRLGGLMGDDRYLSKYKIKETAQVANHVHYEDIARAIESMISQQTAGKTYNVVAPEHPTKQAIIDQQTGNTPNNLQIAVDGRIVTTEKLEQELNFAYKHPDPRYFK